MKNPFPARLGLLILACLSLPLSAADVVELEGPWWFRPDRSVRRGQPNPHPEWADPEIATTEWSRIEPGTPWEEQGFEEYDGVGWYRTTVRVPADWEGSAARLFAGRTPEGAETYWNGESLGKRIGVSAVNSFTLFPDQLTYGGEHALAVRMWNWGGDGGLYAPLRVERLTPPEPFKVEHPEARSLSLLGEWWFKTDPSVKQGAGDDAKGWDEPGLDMEGWYPLRVGMPWESQGLTYNGVAWYRQTVEVPEAWTDDPLILELGKPDDGAEVYWNGESLGRTQRFGDRIQIRVPSDRIRTDAPNMIAVRVWDWYRNGGLTAGTYALSRLAPIVPGGPERGEDTLALGITDDLEEPVVDGNRWRKGFRDTGTSDTRPRLSVAPEGFRGDTALRMEVWYPNSTEYMDARIDPERQGYVWAEREYDYLRFRYRTDSLRGEMRISLNSGGFRWGGSFGTNWKSSFVVEPNGDWTRVTIPFEAFTATRGKKELTLHDPGEITTVSLGYANHELRTAGEIDFADFEVGRYALDTDAEALDLGGLWKFTLDKTGPDGERILIKDPRRYEGYGLDRGWHQPEFDDSDWDVLRIGDPWESQGFSGWDGVGWYRQRFRAPEAWKGLTLKVDLGKADDEARVFLNGEEIHRVTDKGDIAFTLDGAKLNTGGWNTLAVRVVDRSQMGGLVGGPFSMGPELFDLAIGFTESTGRVDPSEFEFGPRPEKNVTLEFRFPSVLSDRDDLKVHARIVDTFHREVARVDLPLERRDGRLVGTLDLDDAQTRQLYYGEWFDATGYVFSEEKGAVKAFASLDNRMRFAGRDTHALPALPEETWEETPYGRLRLVDVIDPTLPPWKGPHPYKQGGIRDSWVGRRAYATWIDGIKVSEYQGRAFREATNNQFFGYRIGRELKPHTAYLVRILYPEDKTRYTVMDIKTGRNQMGTGFRTGISPDNPEDPWPLRGGYHWYDHLVMNDDVTYAHTGRRRADSRNGFWIFFHDPGRIYASAWESGPAVAEIRLYEIKDIKAHYPEIRFPENGPRRSLMMDWEQEPRAVPYDMARWARFMGYTAIAPVFQKWASMGYYDTEMGWNVPTDTAWNTAVREGESNRDLLRNHLEGSARAGIGFVPRVEYGGSPDLPKEARAVGPDGRTAAAGRYASWGANLLHPATLEEFKTLIDEVVGRHIDAFPHIAGLFWRMRNDRMMISFGRRDIEMFAKETGTDLPELDDKALAGWASTGAVGDRYRDWWQRKRRDFHVALIDHLQSIRPDLKLHYYNWDADGIYLGRLGKTPEDYTTFYNVETSRRIYEKAIEHQKTYTDQDYIDMLMRGASHQRPVMEPYREVEDLVYYAPVHWKYLADAPEFLNHFRTGDGLAVGNIGYYEEKSRWNVQRDNYESSEMTPAGAPFSMAYEVLSVFHGDPYALTWTVYTPGRGFADAHRRFAQAYLALPAVRGEIVDATGDPEARARLYPGTEDERYLSVTYRGVEPRRIMVTLPSADVGRVVDLVGGREVEVTREGGVAVWSFDSPPMTLHSFRVEAP